MSNDPVVAEIERAEFFKLTVIDQVLLRGFFAFVALTHIVQFLTGPPAFGSTGVAVGVGLNVALLCFTLLIRYAPAGLFSIIQAVFWITLVLDGFGIFDSARKQEIFTLDAGLSAFNVFLCAIVFRSFAKYRRAVKLAKQTTK
jgi:hypothetical protein